jgi:hypothetical protein
MAFQIQMRRGTAAEWTSSNPVLAAGEFGYETDTGKLKVGNGTSAWSVVTYVNEVSSDTTPQLAGNLDVNGNSIVSASNGNIAITPNGSGKVIIDGLSFPTADGSANQVLKTDGSGSIGFVTRTGAYTGHIETAADKTYTIDPGAVGARTITGFYIKSASGTCTATLKVGSSTVKAASVSSSSGDQSSLANTSVAANDVLTVVVSSNSSALDVIFSVEYTE